MPKSSQKLYFSFNRSTFTCNVCDKVFNHSSEKFMKKMLVLHNKIVHNNMKASICEYDAINTTQEPNEINYLKVDECGLNKIKDLQSIL